MVPTGRDDKKKVNRFKTHSYPKPSAGREVARLTPRPETGPAAGGQVFMPQPCAPVPRGAMGERYQMFSWVLCETQALSWWLTVRLQEYHKQKQTSDDVYFLSWLLVVCVSSRLGKGQLTRT